MISSVPWRRMIGGGLSVRLPGHSGRGVLGTHAAAAKAGFFALDTWENEGGAGGTDLPARTALSLRPRKAEDTAEGCRTHAAADLMRAAALEGEHCRWRYAHSAVAWTGRAELLERREAELAALRRGD